MGKFRISLFGDIQSIYRVTTTMLELNLDNRQCPRAEPQSLKFSSLGFNAYFN